MLIYQIPEEELDRAATSWALEQIKDELDAGEAALHFFRERYKFIEAYRKFEGSEDK